ncbi:uncharacterized protein LOC132167079 [Corylus avellana]|uniref:uncharacterized protein LOC132167079 n=1 Tax=Corylus avellana TaxID=13451 RepID=UPI00286B658A|nr:uncharacterized protein LOC132167079 [Corylus avellana]
MLRHVWSLFARSGSLWVAWVKDYLLKRKSFWSVSIPQNCSWSWRKILKLREIAKRILKFKVGNGENIFLWQDSWHPSGILIEVFGHRAVYDAHSSLEAKLSSVILNGDWFWRPARSEALVEIQTRLHEIKFGPYDKPVWTVSRGGSYVSSETWDFFREKKVEVSWWKIVWFPNAIPKHAFILWLALQDRLLTGDRLMKWGYKGIICFLSFSYRIWKFCMHCCHENNSPIIWDEVLKLGISKWGTKTLKGLLCRLVLGSVIYNLWCTRNELKHSGHPISEEQILRKVLWEVRTRIAGKGKFSKNKENLGLAAQWNLPADLFL